ncbi:thiamine phosphate synthase [Tenacibaculum finnmarkense genomovar finnmarkense]|uniref:thiamine phosphate synthase n=1 Tax=Tenacibaculum finnmarkense TaxID=2781243 RepID=UPI001E65DCE0|nr:thiamine phosphate synthase [Tenacibaculum finnmarkense]MCD8417329.1 thiamine phosphate synthase [Tenacibaculum finnmarkense genomovar finnmarkense]MCG8185776.1 thiamine phosphate synthase [Tenacibaculum finnmarkense genomovar finnmarkense]MCG8202329.1 thiamine phosphate synthase [Tenacibaculum finnmarkense genomovar finnmarkense]MCG8209667.1 thiamine phosphate synthase [Tenacibaculum finnmarkense genomovar finnmarkense]MCG8212529.1 thiamine phosphate synthase [Tenacibaculum finnmarkense ge
MIVLISPEKDVANEMQILHQLFEAGLECYHLRKPSKDYQEHIVYLNQIPEKYHNKIVTHYFHELVNEYSLKGIHFQEQKRRDALENGSRYFIGLKMIGKTMSSSFHEPEELANCDIEFDYHLLSPIFSSISKKGYQGRGFDVNNIDKTIIGMGGITSETISKTLALGFQGIGVLGGVWNSQNAVESFKKIQKEFDSLQ